MLLRADLKVVEYLGQELSRQLNTPNCPHIQSSSFARSVFMGFHMIFRI
jgi:hypothetical protein